MEPLYKLPEDAWGEGAWIDLAHVTAIVRESEGLTWWLPE